MRAPDKRKQVIVAAINDRLREIGRPDIDLPTDLWNRLKDSGGSDTFEFGETIKLLEYSFGVSVHSIVSKTLFPERVKGKWKPKPTNTCTWEESYNVARDGHPNAANHVNPPSYETVEDEDIPSAFGTLGEVTVTRVDPAFPGLIVFRCPDLTGLTGRLASDVGYPKLGIKRRTTHNCGRPYLPKVYPTHVQIPGELELASILGARPVNFMVNQTTSMPPHVDNSDLGRDLVTANHYGLAHLTLEDSGRRLEIALQPGDCYALVGPARYAMKHSVKADVGRVGVTMRGSFPRFDPALHGDIDRGLLFYKRPSSFRYAPWPLVAWSTILEPDLSDQFKEAVSQGKIRCLYGGAYGHAPSMRLMISGADALKYRSRFGVRAIVSYILDSSGERPVGLSLPRLHVCSETIGCPPYWSFSGGHVCADSKQAAFIFDRTIEGDSILLTYFTAARLSLAARGLQDTLVMEDETGGAYLSCDYFPVPSAEVLPVVKKKSHTFDSKGTATTSYRKPNAYVIPHMRSGYVPSGDKALNGAALVFRPATVTSAPLTTKAQLADSEEVKSHLELCKKIDKFSNVKTK